MTYNANGRIGDEGSLRRLTPCLIELAAIDDPHWGGGRRADALEFHPLRDQRAGDKNSSLILLLIDWFTSKGGMCDEHSRAAHEQHSHI